MPVVTDTAILESASLLSTGLLRTFFPTCYHCRDKEVGSSGTLDTGRPAGADQLFLGNFVKSVGASWRCKECQGREPKPGTHLTPDSFFNELQRRFMQRLLPEVEGLDSVCNPSSAPRVADSGLSEHSSNLQAKMRNGTQAQEDFSREACQGYVRKKFSQRARFAFQGVFLAFWGGLPQPQDNIHVCSIGGGPANDTFGAMVALELLTSVRQFGDTRMLLSPHSINYHVFDWVITWSPIVQLVSALSNRTINFGLCDVSKELERECNVAVQELVSQNQTKLSSFLFLFSFVLLESMGITSVVGNAPEERGNLLWCLLERFAAGECYATFLILDAGSKAPKRKGNKSKRHKSCPKELESEEESASVGTGLESTMALHGSLLWVYNLVTTETMFRESYSCKLIRLPHDFYGTHIALVISKKQ